MTLLPYLQGQPWLHQKPVVTRGDVIAFENVIKRHPGHLTAEHFITKHHFMPGIYIRELHIPKGMIVIGRIHKHSHVSILGKGAIEVLVDGRIETVTAPFMTLTQPGFKRIGLALEDTIWSTMHLTDITDVSTLEKELVCDTEEEYQVFLAETERQKCLS